jgi:hypothetical protein
MATRATASQMPPPWVCPPSGAAHRSPSHSGQRRGAGDTRFPVGTPLATDLEGIPPTRWTQNSRKRTLVEPTRSRNPHLLAPPLAPQAGRSLSNYGSDLERSSSLKERAGVKGVVDLRFCVRASFAGRAELTPWRLSPRSCPFPCERVGWVKDRAQPGRASGAGGVLDAGAREPIIEAGRGGLTSRWGLGVCGYGRPIAGVSGWQACWLPSSLRVCPGLGGRGAWGGSRPGAGGANHVSVPVAGPAGAGCGGEHKTSRPRARPGRQLMLPGGWRGGRARRACRRTPGSAGSARRRSWRCRGPRRRGGR